MKHTFRSFWRGRLSRYELLCLQSFLDHGYNFELFSYERHEVPKAVMVRDAYEIMPKGLRVSDQSFSNLFRYLMLYELGGWWVDMDVVCLSSDIPEFETFYARQDDDWINNAIMFFPPRHPVMAQCCDEAEAIGNQADLEGCKTGPFMFTEVLRQQKLLDEAKPASTCYPIHWTNALDVLDPSKGLSLDDGSLFLHLWNRAFDTNHVDKTKPPESGSLLRKLFDAHYASQNVNL